MLWWKEFPAGFIFREEEFFTVPGYLPCQYPAYLARAFLSLTYPEQGPPRKQAGAEEAERPWYRVAWEATEAFVERWGGEDEETLRRVLREGEGRDRLAAVFALGHSPFEGINEELAALLEEPDWLLRCAAACCLVLRRDERAVPVIERYLLTPAPIAVDSEGRVSVVPEASGWYDLYKQLVPWVLAEWGPSSLLSRLRQALLGCCKEEEDHSRPSPTRTGCLKALSYALGRRGALGALHGIRLPGSLRWLTSLYLILGYLRAVERFDCDNLPMQLRPEATLGREVLTFLQDHFALDEGQAQAALKSWQQRSRAVVSWPEREQLQ
ncbi:HEAT repeat domain-containing protein [Thermogemmatispora carboxidivorans]|uniref:HEAT repeat domain-containing protein n=1 Tax=Thermogemmatispora carboxidivorans TaxID=1382306 RepID=UPI00069A3594|nr:HEAT repeat domain-containing protein [Thermogemmatispora carboxidivorans]